MDNKENELEKAIRIIASLPEYKAHEQSSNAGAARQGGNTSEESSANSAAPLASQSQAAQPSIKTWQERAKEGRERNMFVDDERFYMRAEIEDLRAHLAGQSQATIPEGAAIDGNGTTYHNVAEIYYQAECAECMHIWLDDRKVPRADADDKVYSLVGRAAQLVGAESQATKVQAVPADLKNALEMLREADELLWIASGAMLKMGLRDKGSDCGLPHEVRMFALEFSSEGRDGPGALQVRGTGRYRAWLTAARKLCAAPTAQEVTQQAAPEAPTQQEYGDVVTVSQTLIGTSMLDIVLPVGTKLYTKPVPQQAAKAETAEQAKPELTVWYGPMPESNGKSNFTAVLMRKGEMWDGPHVTIERSEYPDRIRYESDRVRHLIGELAEEPFILDYDADKHSGYVAPTTSTVSAPDEIRNAALVEGLEMAARHLDKQRQAVDQDHAYQEPDTGAWVFDRPETEEYSNMLAELAEEIRALRTVSASGSADTGSAA